MIRSCVAILLLFRPLTALADTVAAVNDVRLHGCHGVRSRAGALHENARLDEAAWRMSHGADLHDAAKRAGYRALASTAVHITNVPSDRDIESIVANQFCARIMEPELREIGAYRRGADVWLIAAAAFSPPTAAQGEQIARRVLQLTNIARSHARLCGKVPYPAAAPLSMAPALERAAMEHSRDMAAHGDLDHIGHDGSTPAQRVSRTGYKWRLVGENIASGVVTPEEAVNGWVNSPHHCENLMSRQFSQAGVAYATDPASPGGIYWTQLFATPK